LLCDAEGQVEPPWPVLVRESTSDQHVSPVHDGQGEGVIEASEIAVRPEDNRGLDSLPMVERPKSREQFVRASWLGEVTSDPSSQAICNGRHAAHNAGSVRQRHIRGSEHCRHYALGGEVTQQPDLARST
jgi:hypothetical protein